MDDIILLQEAIDEWRKKHYEISYNQGFIDGYKMCEKRLQTIEPQQKTGKWLDNPITAHSLAKHCSRCGYVCLGYDSITGARFQYCPSCGALMGGKNNEDD